MFIRFSFLNDEIWAAGKAKTEEEKRLSRLNQQKQRQKPDVIWLKVGFKVG